MILYLDASALVKRHVAEPGSAEVASLIETARAIGTAVISRAEVAAALGKAARIGLLNHTDAAAGLTGFEADWDDLVRLAVGEPLVPRAAALAWAQGLRGYDAVHLACAVAWQEAMGDAVTLATYDRELWRGAAGTTVVPWPAASS